MGCMKFLIPPPPDCSEEYNVEKKGKRSNIISSIILRLWDENINWEEGKETKVLRKKIKS